MNKKQELQEKTDRQAMEDLFNEWKVIQYKIVHLGGIIQNYGFFPSKKELKEWNAYVDDTIIEIDELRNLTVDIVERLSDDTSNEKPKDDKE